MSKLMVSYSREIAAGLSKVAVCLPGEAVSPGDILSFRHGKGFLERKAKARGTFRLVTSLDKLGITVPTVPQRDGHPYVFASSSCRLIKVDMGTSVPGKIAAGDLKVEFKEEGSVYFVATGCTTESLSDVNIVRVAEDVVRSPLVWKDTFLVSSVTVARRALILQSRTRESEYVISGEVDALLTNSVNADCSISVKPYKGVAFQMPWSENVTVFMDVFEFTKKNFMERIAAISRAQIAAVLKRDTAVRRHGRRGPENVLDIGIDAGVDCYLRKVDASELV